MNLKHLLSLLIFLILSILLKAQIVTGNRILKLATHPTDSAKFIAKMYNSRTGLMEEYWEMITFVPEISVADFNNQVQARQIVPDGKCIYLYENRAKKMKLNYKNGCKSGEIKGYYKTGELRFQGTYKCVMDGQLTHYYENGSVKKVENFKNGACDGNSVGYDASGKIIMKTEYSMGLKNGKQIYYFPNGSESRIMKYKQDEIVSEKCFNSDGKQIKCNELLIDPAYAAGDDQLISDLRNVVLGTRQTPEDTVSCRIILRINENGTASIQEFFCKTLGSIPSGIFEWLETPGIFTPMIFDNRPAKTFVHLKFSVCGNRIAMNGELKKHHYTARDKFTQEINEVYIWHLPASEKQELYFIANKMPEYPGGEMALKKIIAKRIRYPVQAQKNRIHGKVYVTFVIDESGHPVNFSVAGSVHPLLDSEALRVLKQMPDWAPGESIDGPVAVSYKVPVNFVLPAVGHHSLKTVRIEL